MIFATLNPADKGTNITLSNGNLTAQNASAGWNSVRATLGKSSGKWYWEATYAGDVSGPNRGMYGVVDDGFTVSTYLYGAVKGGGVQTGINYSDGVAGITGVYAGAVGTIPPNTVFGFALDVDAGKVWIRKDGVWVNGDPTGAEIWAGLTGDTWFPAVACNETEGVITVNFGATAFADAVPAGFNAGVFVDDGGGGTLADLVGYVPANFNMLPTTAFAPGSDFTDAQYTLTNASITTGVADPTGATHAQGLIPSVDSGTHGVISASGPQTGSRTPIPYRLAAIAKAAGYSRIVLFWQNFADAAATISVGFDLVGGTTNYDAVVGANATLVLARTTDLGAGYWLCTIDCRYDLTPDSVSHVWQPQILVDDGAGTAARSTTFAGDGSSGVDLWWFNLLHTAAWDLTNKTFEDDFTSLSTIDLTNSKAAGYKWYLNNLYADSFMPTFGWDTNPPSAPSDPTVFSLSSPSVLRIFQAGAVGAAASWLTQLWSTVTDGAGNVSGYSHQPPLVYDGYLNWDGDAAAFNPQWAGYAAFWGVPIEALQDPSISGMTSDDHFNELDVSEAVADNLTCSLHDWSVPASPVRTTIAGGGGPSPGTMVLGTFRRLSAMWLRPEDTGAGWGIFLFFLDGQFRLFTDGAYHPTEGSVGGHGDHAAPYGSGSDQHHLNVILNSSGAVASGDGQAFYIDWVRVYTKPDVVATGLFRSGSLNGLGGGGPFFVDPLS